ASGVAIVTGHFSTEENSHALDFAALSKMPTLVVLMGVHTAGSIAERLIEAGRDPATPAAMIQTAFWPGEKIVVGTLETIAEIAAQQNVVAPATLVIGEVVRMHGKLSTALRELQRSVQNAAEVAA
ncbi:MAG: SAM-dependent methyltransferase, partial [Acidobacteriaceae bacterium]|nr:SAM-dependent methyltransferase [Acidobacteriaceae bacterium]